MKPSVSLKSKNFMNSVAEGIAMEIATELWLNNQSDQT